MLGHQLQRQGARRLVVGHDVPGRTEELGEEGVARARVVVVDARHRLHRHGVEPQAEPGSTPRPWPRTSVRLQRPNVTTRLWPRAIAAPSRNSSLRTLLPPNPEAAQVLVLHPQSVDVLQGVGDAPMGARAIAQVHGAERAGTRRPGPLGQNGAVGPYRDAGVVLRTHKLGEADRIVTLLTRDRGS